MVTGFRDTGVCVMVQVFYYLLWVTTHYGNRPAELIKAMHFVCQMWDVTLKCTTVGMGGMKYRSVLWVRNLNM